MPVACSDFSLSPCLADVFLFISFLFSPSLCFQKHFLRARVFGLYVFSMISNLIQAFTIWFQSLHKQTRLHTHTQTKTTKSKIIKATSIDSIDSVGCIINICFNLPIHKLIARAILFDFPPKHVHTREDSI